MKTKHGFGWWRSLAKESLRDTADQMMNARGMWFPILMAAAGMLALGATLYYMGYGPNNPLWGNSDLCPRQAQDSGQQIQVEP